MAQVVCSSCGSREDARAMLTCDGCQNYICPECTETYNGYCMHCLHPELVDKNSI